MHRSDDFADVLIEARRILNASSDGQLAPDDRAWQLGTLEPRVLRLRRGDRLFVQGYIKGRLDVQERRA